MTLNIGRKLKDAPSRARSKLAAKAALRRPLVDETLAELTAWNPREFISAFQRWHQGSLSLVHLSVLTMLESSGPMSMGRLADSLGISVASITGVIDRMEARGLVERRREAEDRRVVLVVPAKGAQKVFGEIDGRRRKSLQKLLSRLTDDELQGLLAGHRALRAARMELGKQLGGGGIEAARGRLRRARTGSDTRP